MRNSPNRTRNYLVIGGILIVTTLVGCAAFSELFGEAALEETMVARSGMAEASISKAIEPVIATEEMILSTAAGELLSGAELSEARLISVLKELKVEFPAGENPRILTIEKGELLGEVVEQKELVLRDNTVKIIPYDVYAFDNNDVSFYSTANESAFVGTVKEHLNHLAVVTAEENGFYRLSMEDGNIRFVRKADMRPVLVKKAPEEITTVPVPVPVSIPVDSIATKQQEEKVEQEEPSVSKNKIIRWNDRGNAKRFYATDNNNNDAYNVQPTKKRSLGGIILSTTHSPAPDEHEHHPAASGECAHQVRPVILAFVSVHFIDRCGRERVVLERRWVPAPNR